MALQELEARCESDLRHFFGKGAASWPELLRHANECISFFDTVPKDLKVNIRRLEQCKNEQVNVTYPQESSQLFDT